MTVEFASRKMRVSPEAMEQWFSRDSQGRRVHVEWGEPDDEGFYDPVFSVYKGDPVLFVTLPPDATPGDTDSWRAAIAVIGERAVAAYRADLAERVKADPVMVARPYCLRAVLDLITEEPKP